jgi:hypothetical protein
MTNREAILSLLLVRGWGVLLAASLLLGTLSLPAVAQTPAATPTPDLTLTPEIGLTPEAEQTPEAAQAPEAAATPGGGLVPAQPSLAWSEPIMMGPGWFPEITADASGGIHVAWSSVVMERDPTVPSLRPSPGRGYSLVLYRSTRDGVEWTDAHDIAAFRQSEGSEATRPSLLVDQYGTMHMTFRYNRIFYSNTWVGEAGSAKNWMKYFPMSVDQVAYYSRIDQDSLERLHVVYTENVRTFDCPICYHLFHRYSDDNGRTWSIRSDVSSLPIGAAKPQIVIDQLDNIHVTWEAGRGGALGQLNDPTTVMYAASYDRGVSWTRPLEFVVPDGRAKNIAIGLDGLGQLVVAWVALPENTVYYQVSNNQGRSWTEAEPVPGIRGGFAVYNARLDQYTFARDSAGDLHLVLVGRTVDERRTLELLHLTWNGIGWSAPDLIYRYIGDAPEWPEIAISNGNQLHVVWFIRDEEHIFDSDRAEYSVWYSTRTIDSPEIEPVVFPTPTPVPIIQPTPTLAEPSPTPVDPSISMDPVPEDLATSIYSEFDDMLVMARALIPAAVIILLVIGIIRLRK